jgi:hypothetical protein
MSSTFLIIFHYADKPVNFVTYMSHLLYIYTHARFLGVGCRLYSLQDMVISKEIP